MARFALKEKIIICKAGANMAHGIVLLFFFFHGGHHHQIVIKIVMIYSKDYTTVVIIIPVKITHINKKIFVIASVKIC